MAGKLRVLLVEDSEDDAALVLAELKRAGYELLSERVYSAQALQDALSRREWDFVIADYSMPSFTGLEALKLVRGSGRDMPFIVVSGTIGEDVAVDAMKAGANDYLIKDRLARLAPAVERELREATERRDRRVAESELRESENRYRGAMQEANLRLQSLSSRMLEVQESERRHIARELHDEIGQALTAVKLHLQSAMRRCGPEARQPLEECVLITDQALDQVRNLSLNLRPSQLDDLGLVAALRWQIGRQAAASGLHTEFEADELNERLEAALETACFRFVQEAMTNVVRHAQARNAWIEARRNGDRLRVSVRDDGRGFDVAAATREAIARGSLGLLGMQERVGLAGGRLNVSSRPAEGTTIVAEFPLRFAPPRARRARRNDNAGSSTAR
ncbi:MAG TPA: response regulator [Burkholderiales bacterium]|nr:response regulator [Burkholderiales bacterium]